MSYKKPSVPTRFFDAFWESVGDLSGKTFVVTGTTSGTGRIAARSLAEKGARVVMLNRPSSRSEKVQEEMDRLFADGRVSSVDCDLQQFASVREAAKRLNELCSDGGIYALINNAGILREER